ncbi:MAG: Coenzyme F420 hydrogenase/dehydrogenase, beta subunit C-terminal domain [Lachnospiraceae bacterium]
MKTVCKLNKCVGCHTCEELCPKGAIQIVDSTDCVNAVVDEKSCINCNLCEKVCQVNYPLEKKKPVEWFQGWSKSDDVREKSSSGGLAAELSRTVVKEGGVVCSCVFENGQFIFKFAESIEELKGFAGSKYVKSNPMGVYKKIKEQLNGEKTILFIGLPCQCAAVKKATEKVQKGKLYTVDLICHGTPSPKTLNAFFNQYSCNLKDIQTIRFRDKGKFSLEKNEKHIVTPGTMDCYSIAFLNGLIYTENCYECVYADSKRVTDITIGDSWGTELSEGGRGVSLILCNTEQGKKLVKKGNVYLTDVNIENAIASNPQLRAATVMPAKRASFFSGYKQGKKFNRLVMKCCKKKWFKQIIKRQLIKAKIIGGG